MMTPQQAGMALYLAIDRDNLSGVRSLIDKYGADVNAVRKDGWPLLHYAAAFGRDRILTALLEAGADVHAQDDCGKSCLWHAISNQNCACVKILIEAGADTAFCYEPLKDGSAWTDARHAHRQGGDIAEAVGAVADRYYLNFAASRAEGEHAGAFLQWMTRLLDKGTPVDTRDRFGKSALIWCCEHGDAAGVEMLLFAKADPNFRMKNGNSPLHVLARSGDLKLFDKIVQAGGDVRRCNKEGQTPLDIATAAGERALAQYIRARMDEDDARTERTVTHLKTPLKPMKKITIARGKGRG